MSSTQFSVRLPDDQKEFLDSLAEATDSSRNQLITSAVAKMMDNYAYVLAKVDQGDADVAAGRVFSMEEVASSTQAIIDKFKK